MTAATHQKQHQRLYKSPEAHVPPRVEAGAFKAGFRPVTLFRGLSWEVVHPTCGKPRPPSACACIEQCPQIALTRQTRQHMLLQAKEPF